MSKYELNSAEERYQPGSGDLVLVNKLGIIDEQEMEALESSLLLICYMNSYLSKASRQRRWLLSTSAGGIANGWGMCAAGRGGCNSLKISEINCI